MKKAILFLLLLCPIMFYGQEDATTDIVSSIGGTINVSVFGGAVYLIPLELPQGVNDMKPEIGIVYNSQAGNGLLGYGWDINGISAITRTGSTLYHNGMMTAANLSDNDQFMLDGQRLIMVESNNRSIREYKTENDEFSQISFTLENGYYTKCDVKLENGNIIKYGHSIDSKLMSTDGNNVIKWMVSSIVDRNGNTISYNYTTYGTDSDLYISSISYTSNSQVGLNPQFTVSFTYSTTDRFDDYHYYIAGNKVQQSRILTRIDVKTGNEIIESYRFSYNGNEMYNLLTEISLVKGNYEAQSSLIQWNTDIPYNTLYSKQITKSILNDFSFVGDFNGDGYSDLLTVPYKPTNGYSGDTIAKAFLNNMHGEFSATPNYTITIPDSLEWIHVFDINGDGYDDLIAQTLKTNTNTPITTYSTGFIIYESQQGNGFVIDTTFCINNRLLVRVGDFMGEGRNSLLLIKILADEIYDNYEIFGCPALIHYDNVYNLTDFIDSFRIIDEGLIVTGDFKGDGITEFITIGSGEIWTHSLYKQNGQYRMSSSNEYFGNDERASYYTGDFNDDGKDDLLFNDGYYNKYIVFSTGDGFTDWISVYDLDNIIFPPSHTYIYSLNNVVSDVAYGVNVSDLDGDGKSDVMFFDGKNQPVFFRNFSITDPVTPAGNFNIVSSADHTNIQFKNQYFTMGNFLGQDHVSFIAVDPQSIPNTEDDIVKIFSFPSTSEIFSVKSIIDGYGNTTSIEYDYLMPGNPDFYSYTNRPFDNDVKPIPIPMMAMKSYTESFGSNNYKTQFKYGNLLIHRKGRGFVNFEEVEKTSYINNIAVKQEKNKFELTTMGANAIALPQCDSTFLFNSGNKILSETNSYTFQNVGCNRQATTNNLRLIVRPAMISRKTKRFDPDTPGQLLSVELTEYTYNYRDNYTYSNAYGCTRISTGANGFDCNSVGDCEYRNITDIVVFNNFTDWIVNRKSEETSVTQFSSRPAITKKTKYSYTVGRPLLVSTKTDYPNSNEKHPLTVRHSYQYDNCGNIITETVSAPYGIHNETPIVTSYKYNDYRLVAAQTVDPNGLSYQDQYIYDKYDRVTSHTGSNGLTTTYTYSNTFGTAMVATAPGNVKTTEYLAWAEGEDLAPANALYYKYSHTTGSPATETFYDAKGNAIRTLTVNYELEPIIVDVCYNDRQLPTLQSQPYIEGNTPQWTTFQYDGLGRITNTTTPDGTIISVDYYGLTTINSTTSNNSTRTTKQETNYLGWVTKSTDASQAEVNYSYFSDGKVKSLVTSEGNVTVSMTYDDAGNRATLNDMDYGQILSVYDAFGRLIQQTTPKSDNFYYTYDVMGRVTQKTAQSDATTTSYQYNEETHKGTLASVIHNGQTIQYTYDSYDRLATVTETRIGSSYTTSYEYNNNSKISAKTYPSGYKVYYGYYTNGTKKYIKDAQGHTLWRTNEINANGQLLRATTGNGAVTTNTYDVATNRLTGSATSNGIQNFAYSFDGFGNLTSRTDSIGNIRTETFTYDDLDRLTGIMLNNVSNTIVYDNYGRMTSKQKDGSSVFSSAQFSASKPHAPQNISTTSTEFPESQIIEYNSLDKVKRLVQGSKNATFTYGYDGQRMRMVVTDTLGGYTKTKDYVGNCEFVDDNGMKQVYTYLMGPYGVFAMVINSGGTTEVLYVYKDHLGSWTTITDSIGSVVERKSFDAWGNLRNPLTWTGLPSRTPKFDRGFTGHEHLYNFGLINMNGRMYDPLLSSFLSPDNYMQDPTTQQGFNRYAYCMYNPLKYTDPTGERPWGWCPSSYQLEQDLRYLRRIHYEWYLAIMQKVVGFSGFINSIYSIGLSGGGCGGPGCAMGSGGPSGPSGNGHGDGEPSITISSNSDGRPGSSENNPISANNLTDICDWHYCFGEGRPLYVDASTIDFSFLSQGVLEPVNDNIYTINLFTFPYMFLSDQLSMALGRITLTCVGDNMYEIWPDKYNFDVKHGEYFSSWRNFATAVGGVLHGGINEPTFLLYPATYWGGEFDIIFVNRVYIKP